MQNLFIESKDFLDNFKLDFDWIKDRLSNIMHIFLEKYKCKSSKTIIFEENELFGRSGSVTSSIISINKTRIETLMALNIDDTDNNIIDWIENFYQSYLNDTEHSKYNTVLYEFIKKYKSIGAERFFNNVGSYKTVKYELLATIYHECQHILQNEKIVNFTNQMEENPFFALINIFNTIFKEIKIANIDYERNPDNLVFPIELDARYTTLKLLTELKNEYYKNDELFKIYLEKTIILPESFDVETTANLVYEEYVKLFDLYHDNISTKFDKINQIIVKNRSKIIKYIVQIYNNMIV